MTKALTRATKNPSGKRRGRALSPLYIQVAQDERSRVPPRHLTSQIRVRLEDAMRAGVEPTSQSLVDAARVFGDVDDARRQTLWVPTEIREWVRSIARARHVPMTEVIRALCPDVFQPSIYAVAVPETAQVI